MSRFFRWLFIVAGVVVPTLLSITRAGAESPAVCQAYATEAVNDYNQAAAARCPLSNARWQPNYNNHYGWCLNAPTAWVQSEANFRRNELAVCKHEQRASQCREYAITAQSQAQSGVGCGFSGGRWHNSYDLHLDWCLHNPIEAANAELNTRYLLLGVCGRDPRFLACDAYARRAVAQNLENERRNCGYTGGRWQNNYENHLGWCINVDQQARDSESREREGPLSQCRTWPARGATVASGCAVSTIVRNDQCRNVDGTGSSLQPGGSQAVGCGASAQEARERALFSYRQTFGALNDGDQPANGSCTYDTEDVAGCLCL
ncbi:MAG: hypothetical protein ABW034_07365 [Steroidobacteraceae bacterium]